MSLTFAIDFDDTLTACPELWCRFIADAESNGHRVFLVTARRETEENVEIVREFMKEHGLSLPRLFTNLVSDHRLLASIKPLNCDKPVRSSPPLNIPAFSIPIRVDTSIPMTLVPPESGSPHFSYGPEDEEWMRPLGLGKLVPTAVFINRELIDSIYASFNIPEKMFSGDSNYSSAIIDRRYWWNS